MEVTREMLAAKFEVIFPHLDERQRRLVMGAEARALGHGGIRLVARAAGVREATVSLGVDELDSGAEPLGRARRPGGGRKRAADADPGLRPALLALVEPEERGDPVSPLRWTTKSTRKLAAELTARGNKASAPGTGRRPGLTLADRLLATILHYRLHLPQVAIAALFSVRPETISKRIRDIRQLLDQAGHTIQPGPHRLANLDDLHELAGAEGLSIPSEINTAC
jgi:hypothetical protein